MEEAMSEQHWRDVFRAAVTEHSHSQAQAEGLVRALQPHFEAAYARGLMAGKSQAGYREVRALPGGALTQRQLEVARLTAGGLSNKEIGEKLYLSENSVKTHLRHAMKKIGARSRGHLAAILVANGQADPQGERQ